MGAQLIKKVASQTNDVAGDGMFRPLLSTAPFVWRWYLKCAPEEGIVLQNAACSCACRLAYSKYSEAWLIKCSHVFEVETTHILREHENISVWRSASRVRKQTYASHLQVKNLPAIILWEMTTMKSDTRLGRFYTWFSFFISPPIIN